MANDNRISINIPHRLPVNAQTPDNGRMAFRPVGTFFVHYNAGSGRIHDV